MKASAHDLNTLLDIQNLDTKIAQLDHQRAVLPESVRRETLVQQLAELNTESVLKNSQLTDLNRELAKAEDEVQAVRSRAERDTKLIDSGTITNPKQITDLQHEVKTLARRQHELEDVELELMQRVEDLSGAIDTLAAQMRETQTELDAVTIREAEILTDLDSEATAAREQRDSSRAELPTELVALYERARAATGIGAARLVGNACQGCHMQLAPTDLRRIETADSDEVVRCEECRCILVRNAS